MEGGLRLSPSKSAISGFTAWPCPSLPGPQSTYLFKEGVVAAMLGALQHKPCLATGDRVPRPRTGPPPTPPPHTPWL